MPDVTSRASRTGKRWLSALALGCSAALTLTACGSSGSSGSSDAKGPVTLTYALWDQNEQVGYQKSIAQFEKLHPDIHVKIEQLDWNDYWTKLEAELSAGDAPDVFWDHIAYFPQLVQQGALLNLSSYIKQDKIDTSIYYPSLLKSYQYQGGQYGLPKDWDTIALVCNTAALAKAGESNPGKLAWSPNGGGSLLTFAKKLTVDSSGKNATQSGFDAKHIKQYGLLAWDTLQEGWGNWMAANGGSLMDKPFGKFTLDSPQDEQALQAYVDLVNKYHVSPSGAETHTAVQAGNAIDQFLGGGQAACSTAGDWELTGLMQQSKAKFTVLPMPAGPQGTFSAFNGLSDAISAHTKHPQQAWELEKWLASAQSQKIMGSGGYVWPAIKSLDNTFVAAWKSKGIDVQPYLDEANGKTFSFPVSPGWNAANQQITTTLDQVFEGNLSVSKGLKQAVDQANQAAQQAG